MPTYTYRCKNCENEFDQLQRLADQVLTKCPTCGEESLIRLIGSGAGLVFKGSGFYKTDYKSGSGGRSTPSSKPAKEDVKPESKPEAKSEPNTDSSSTKTDSSSAKSDSSSSSKPPENK